MTIAQYLPRWLRRRSEKPALVDTGTRSKSDRQALPELPARDRAATTFPGDGEGPAGIRARWHICA